MAVRRITASEAVVRTATVDVKVLTISGKQVTLAVFRQLPERALVDPVSVQLAGVPWGRVNYHPDPACKDGGAHMHVVWQQGDELFRAHTPLKRPAVAAEEAPRDALARAIRQLAEVYLYTLYLDGADPPKRHNGRVRVDIFGYVTEVPVSDVIWVRDRVDGESYALKHLYDRLSYRPVLDDDQTKHLARLCALHRLGDSPTPKGVREAYAELHVRKETYEGELVRRDARWAQQYAVLQALDQLYIAV